MEGKDLLMMMGDIDPEYVQEASRPFKKKKTPHIRYIGYYVGMAASLFIAFVCGYNALVWDPQNPDYKPTPEVASAVSTYGNLPLILMMLSLALFILLIFLLIKEVKSER